VLGAGGRGAAAGTGALEDVPLPYASTLPPEPCLHHEHRTAGQRERALPCNPPPQTGAPTDPKISLSSPVAPAEEPAAFPGLARTRWCVFASTEAVLLPPRRFSPKYLQPAVASLGCGEPEPRRLLAVPQRGSEPGPQGSSAGTEADPEQRGSTRSVSCFVPLSRPAPLHPTLGPGSEPGPARSPPPIAHHRASEQLGVRAASPAATRLPWRPAANRPVTGLRQRGVRYRPPPARAQSTGGRRGGSAPSPLLAPGFTGWG